MTGRPRKPYAELSQAAVWKRLQRERSKVGWCSDCGKQGPTDWHHIGMNYAEDAELLEICRGCHNHRHKKKGVVDA